MALQGDLASFALPDVLRLLAGTAKSGRLAVTGSPHVGEVWLREGRIAGGTVTSRASATTPAEIVFELLQFDGGSFLFDDGDQLVEDGDTTEVEAALGEAETLQAEWQEVGQVVPSLDHWVSIAPELGDDEVTIDGERWKLLAAVAGGAPVHAVADQFSIGDLEASKRVKALVEGGLVAIGEPRSDAAPVDEWTDSAAEPAEPAEVSAFDNADLTDHSSEGDLVHLSAEEGPVVLESSEDALLPEPLPGEGTSFSSDDDASYQVDALDASSPATDAADHGIELDVPPAVLDDVDHELPDAVDDPAMAWDALARGTGAEDEIGTSEEAFRAVGWDERPPVDHLSDEGHDQDPDRSSLLKFLSSVKP